MGEGRGLGAGSSALSADLTFGALLAELRQRLGAESGGSTPNPQTLTPNPYTLTSLAAPLGGAFSALTQGLGAPMPAAGGILFAGSTQVGAPAPAWGLGVGGWRSGAGSAREQPELLLNLASSYLTGAAAPQSAIRNPQSALADIALRHLGSPYVWGGHSPSGFDCTGFTWYVANQAGIQIPQHDLAGQMASGRRVGAGLKPAPTEVQAGDLVFFENTYRRGLSHVGIALGDGRFVHAASETQGVTTSSLSDPYWAQRYVGATRLGAQGPGFEVLGSGSSTEHPTPSTRHSTPGTRHPAPSTRSLEA